MVCTLYALQLYTSQAANTQSWNQAVGPAEDTVALEEHLRKVGALEVLHSPAPAVSTEQAMSDGQRADFLVKLMSHVRLHLLYVAEKLQEHLVAPEGEMASAASNGQSSSQVMLVVISSILLVIVRVS